MLSTYFRKLKEIGVLRPIFPDYVISCDYDFNQIKSKVATSNMINIYLQIFFQLYAIAAG